MEVNELTNKSSSISKYFIFILIVCIIFIGYEFIWHPSLLSRFGYESKVFPLIESEFSNNTKSKTRTLVVYVYAKTHQAAEQNLAFFIRTAVRDSHDADYYFILQQVNNITVDEQKLPSLPSNAHYIQHENKCYDIGTIGWFLSKDFIDRTKYKYFIFINSSVRGPFIVSYYDNEIWYTVFTRRLNNHIKLVGCTINCEITPHVQSYFWALDFIGLDILLKAGTVFACYDNQGATIYKSEIGASRILIDSGFGIGSLMKKYQNMDFRLKENKNCNNVKNPTFTNVDGISLDPFEIVFVKLKDEFEQYKHNRERVTVYEKWIYRCEKKCSGLNPMG